MSKADRFLERKTANPHYKPLYHLSAPYGWINDPNGFCFYKGGWHLFYQYNPYAAHWGRMHWGHAVSQDLCNWEHLPVALSPDCRGDNFLGCFSGSAVEKGGLLYLMYTGVPFIKQHQMLAESSDGIIFQKHSVPAIPIKNRPPKTGKNAFRDPKIIVNDGKYYCVIGASCGNGRQIALYKSDSLTSWEYVASLKTDPVSKGIFECPDLACTDKGDILIYSVMYTKTRGLDYQNIHSSVYELGRTDFTKGEFLPYGEPKEFDKGADFYAPQTTRSPDGRIIMVAWMQMWHHSIPAAYLGHGYAGMFTLPRELEIRGGKLYQKPVREVYSLFGEGAAFSGYITEEREVEGARGSVYLLKLSIKYSDNLTIKLRKGADCHTSITFDNGLITFNREKCGYSISGPAGSGNCNIRHMLCDASEELSAEIFVDKSSVELFVNGCNCMSNTVYPFEDGKGITFASGKGAEAKIEFRPYIK